MCRIIPSYRLATEIEKEKRKIFRERLDNKDKKSLMK